MLSILRRYNNTFLLRVSAEYVLETAHIVVVDKKRFLEIALLFIERKPYE